MKKATPLIQGANILLTYGDSILLQLRDDKPSISYPGHWGLPGGQREGQETPKENAIRELMEECGYKMTAPRLILRKTVKRQRRHG